MTAAFALFWTAIVLYGLAGLLYAGFLVGAPAKLSSRAARLVMLAAFVVHMLEIGRRGISGVHPVSSSGEAIGFLAWLVAGAFLAVSLRRKVHAIGALVAPAAVLLLVSAYFSPEFGTGSTAGLGVLGRVHIMLAIAGVSSFALATALAVFYLVQERQLKRRRIGLAVRRGAALETLDRMIHRTVQIGFPIFTFGVLTGAIWTAERSSALRVENIIATGAWSVFAALLIARQVAGWRGRRAALLTIAGFAATAAVLAIYLWRGGAG